MKTSAAPRTTARRASHADPSDAGEAPCAAADRHDQGSRGAAKDDRSRGTGVCRAPGTARRSRDDRTREPPPERPARQGDDWGVHPLGDAQRRDLLEILEDRYGNRSTLVTSQLPVETWHDAIGDATLADALLDRLIHNAYQLKLKGESMRKKKALVAPAGSSS